MAQKHNDPYYIWRIQTKNEQEKQTVNKSINGTHRIVWWFWKIDLRIRIKRELYLFFLSFLPVCLFCLLQSLGRPLDVFFISPTTPFWLLLFTEMPFVFVIGKGSCPRPIRRDNQNLGVFRQIEKNVEAFLEPFYSLELRQMLC